MTFRDDGSKAAALEVDNLTVAISTRDARIVWPVRDVSLLLSPGETVAVVGESGCGKSMTCLALAGLLPRRARSQADRWRLSGCDMAALSPGAARRLRRRHISVVFQDATNGLNPVKTIGWQVAEAVRLRTSASWRAARLETVRLLERVGMPDPGATARRFPHQLSGGMNQRAMIALAVAGGPSVLIADEATTALDVTVQAQILALIADLQREDGMALVFITHDLGIVAQIADKVAVMYAGRIVESAPVTSIFAAPRHPYTAGLIASLPRMDRRVSALKLLEGQVPAIHQMPPGCAFAPRCSRVTEACRTALPPLTAIAQAQRVACLHPMPTAQIEAA